jgi:hypothetical protein
MTSTSLAVPIDHEAILQTLNLNPRDPKTQALILICDRYGLDPVLKHVVLISGNVYVTRDGLLHVAHTAGVLDGITVDEEGENDDEWWARVSVYVKGQTHPYTYKGRYPKGGHQKRYGPEMAVKCAEVMALRRAVGVTGVPTVEEQWDKSDALEIMEIAPEWATGPLVGALNAIEDETYRKHAKQAFVDRFGRPDVLPAAELEAAASWVEEIVAGSASPLSSGGEGDAASSQEEAAMPVVEASTVVSAEASPPAQPEPVDGFGRPESPKSAFHRLVAEYVKSVDGKVGSQAVRHAVIDMATDGATANCQHASRDALEAAVELLTQMLEGTWVVVDERLVLASEVAS